MAEQKMKGIVAIVTGSSSGIGAGIAIEYARLGAHVTITGRKEDKLQIVAKQCEEASIARHKPLIIIGDITEASIRKKLIEDTVRKFGSLHVLVNNAGVFKSVPVETDAGFGPLDDMLNIHVRVPYHLSKLAVPHLLETKGAIINISSCASFKPCSSVGLEYGVAKGAMDQLTRWFAFELGTKGVRVNSINPGVVPTDFLLNSGGTQDQSNDLYAASASLHALGRVGKVDEIARVASFLACRDSSFVTGTILPVDGGFMVVPTKMDVPELNQS